MKVVYFSFSGNVRRFIKRSEISDVMEITKDNCTDPFEEPYILVTGTIGFGEVPKEVQSFLEINHHNLRAAAQVVTVTGDKTLRKRVEQFPKNIMYLY